MFDEVTDHLEWLARLCAKAEGASCDLMYGNELVFSVGDEMFGLFHIEQKRHVSVAFRPAPGDRDRLLALPGVEVAAFPADGGWVMVTEAACNPGNPQSIPRDELGGWLKDSYEAVLRRQAG